MKGEVTSKQQGLVVGCSHVAWCASLLTTAAESLGVQGALQPPTGTAQFSMQPFSTQPHGLGLTLHSPAPGASLNQPMGLGPTPQQHQAPPQHHQHQHQAPPQHQASKGSQFGNIMQQHSSQSAPVSPPLASVWVHMRRQWPGLGPLLPLAQAV